MKYVLDTDILIYFFSGHQSVIDRISAVLRTDYLSTTIFNKTELLYGAFNSAKIDHNLKKIQESLRDIKVLEFSHEASFIFAEHKAQLKKNGNIVADMDLMIASVVLANDGILVTNNTKHFQKVKKLKLENWAS